MAFRQVPDLRLAAAAVVVACWMSSSSNHVPLPSCVRRPPAQMRERAANFYDEVNRRRTVRDFSDDEIPDGVVEDCLRAAGTAPSGANQQPWHFAVVRDAEIRRRIRMAAEEEEKAFYGGRAPEDWLRALGTIGTSWEKPFLETAPCLIAIFQQNSSVAADGSKVKHYYPKESVGLADRLAHHRAPSRRAGDTDTHAEPDGVLERDLGAARKREAFPAARRRLPERVRDRARSETEIARGTCHLFLNGDGVCGDRKG